MKKSKHTKPSDAELFLDAFTGNSLLADTLNKIASSPERVEAMATRFIKYYDKFAENLGKYWEISTDQAQFINTLEKMQTECIQFMKEKGVSDSIPLVTHILNHSFSTNEQTSSKANITAEVYFLTSNSGPCLWDRFTMEVDSPVLCYFLTIYTYNAQRLYRIAPNQNLRKNSTKNPQLHPERFKALRSHLNPINNLYSKSVDGASGLLTVDQLNVVAMHIRSGINDKKKNFPFLSGYNSPHPNMVVESELALTTAYSRFNSKGKNIYQFPVTLVGMLRNTENDDITVEKVKLPHSSLYIHFGSQKDLIIKGVGLLDGAYVESKKTTESHILKITFTTSPVSTDEKWFLSPEIYFTYEINLNTHCNKNLYTVLNEGENSLTQQEENFPEYKKALRLLINALYFTTAFPDYIEEDWGDETPTHLITEAKTAKEKLKVHASLIKEGYILVNHCGRGFDCNQDVKWETIFKGNTVNG